jgi:hypothetical protein
MEHTVEVFYVSHEVDGGKRSDCAKFFTQKDADDFASQNARRHNVRVDKKVERMIDQHPAHRPG